MITVQRIQVVMFAWCCLLLAAPLASAADDDYRKHPAYVDGQPLVTLAGTNDTLVDMQIDGAVLKSLAKRYTQKDPELATFLGDLLLINSVVITCEQAVPQPATDTAISTFQAALPKRGWRKLANIRERDVTVAVFMHLQQNDIDGLLVLSVEPKRIIYSNLAGAIDVSRLARLRGTLTVPGLERIPSTMPAPDREASPTTPHAAPIPPTQEGSRP